MTTAGPATVIVARFPHGVFRGREPDGTPSRYPSLARLCSALTHAAGTGSTAIEDKGELRPSADAIAALEWLEQHPPSGLSLPKAVPSSPGHYAIYRDEGVLEKSGKTLVSRKTLRPFTGTALLGEVAWIWAEGIPSQHRSTLDDLMADVSCLGEADSPVVLEFGDAEATHVLDPTATEFSIGGFQIEAPAPGRFQELEKAHRLAHPPRKGASRVQSPTAKIKVEPIPRSRTRMLTYRSPSEAIGPMVPWPEGVYLEVKHGRTPSPNYAVSACVTLHRTLALLLPQDAPAAITGNYADDVPKPANRVALHFLDETTAAKAGLPGSGFVVLFPSRLGAEEQRILDDVLPQVQKLEGRGVACSLRPPVPLDGKRFWGPPPPGLKRLWWGYPALVPETRSRDPRWGKAQRSFEDAALLSVGLVLRDQLDQRSISASTKWFDIADQVRKWGVRTLMVQRILSSQPKQFVHRVPDGMVVEPYRALIDLSGVVPDSAFMAIGQNRHLGGGLLIPEDLPAGTVDVWRET